MDNKRKPLVSVIIATRNQAEPLKHAIESVLWQTFTDFELWIISAHDSDEIAEVVRSYDRDPRIHAFNIADNHFDKSTLINEGIKRAQGRFIAYMNPDDIWLPQHLDVLVNHIEMTDADFAFSIVQRVYSLTFSRPEIPLLPDMPILPEMSSVIHRKQVIDKIGYWKTRKETRSIPSVEFLRRAQHHKLSFEIASAVTTLRFQADVARYGDTGLQALYIQRLTEEPDFINKELSAMLIRAEHGIQSFPSTKRLMRLLTDPLRKLMLSFHLDPALIGFSNGHQAELHIGGNENQLSELMVNPKKKTNSTPVPVKRSLIHH